MGKPRLRGQDWIDYRLERIELKSNGKVQVKKLDTKTRLATFVCKKHGSFSGHLGKVAVRTYPCPTCLKEDKKETPNIVEAKSRFEDYLSTLPYKKVTDYKGSYAPVTLACSKHKTKFDIIPNAFVNNKNKYPCKECLAEWKASGAGQLRDLKDVKSLLPSNVVMLDAYKGSRVRVKFKCTTCNFKWKTIPDSLTRADNSGCPKCNKPLTLVSQGEDELARWIAKLVKCNTSNRLILDAQNLELDIVVPSHKLAIEYNGIYWHSSEYKYPNYHKWKQDLAKDKGYRVLYVHEDDWNLKRKVVKHTLRHILGLSKNRLQARKLDLKKTTKLESNTIKDFFTKYHIQGYPNKVSGLAYGLFDGFTLVACMLFTNIRSERGSQRVQGEWELLRFASACSVAGGASRLFTNFVRDLSPERVVSYSDNDMFEGSLYETLGFSFVKDVKPDYKVISGGRRRHKSFFRKARLQKILGTDYDENLTEREMCENAGLKRIYDSGKKKWEFVPT